MLKMILALAILQSSQAVEWQKQSINTAADFRGLCAVSESVAWVSGNKGTIGRTTDGGKTWHVTAVPGAEKLDVRDIEAFSDKIAYTLSIGPGEQSRIYKTTDGGVTWTCQWTNPDPEAFYDAIAFWDEQHGIAFSDPVKGHYRLLRTDDGGKNWKVLPIANMPPALPGEGAFAASGTCLVTQGQHDAWFVTGGAKTARLFHSIDRGDTWTVNESPILAGIASAGIFSIAFRDQHQGLLVGGDYQKPSESNRTVATTSDGAKTWKLIDGKLPFCSCAVWTKNRWLAAGTTGTFHSTDGLSWIQIDKENYNVISAYKDGAVWAAGPKGRIARLK
jgi:photosystem II stability/assembly factor-like uncharacterized protein